MAEADSTDGRRARSERTRNAVAQAMLECLEEGILRPSSAEVAERAGVSSRAVFRHFENMEALLEKVAKLQMQKVIPQLPPVETEGPLEARLDALVRRAARLHEITAPVRRAALLNEPFSEVIRERHAYIRGVERRLLCDALSRELRKLPKRERDDRTAAISGLLSFAYWDELRRHSKLSSPAAARVVRSAIDAVLVA